MKKNSILIAAFAVIVAASAAKAQAPVLDFDGNIGSPTRVEFAENFSIIPDVPPAASVESKEMEPEQRTMGAAIKYAIKSCNQDKTKASVCEGLKKLAAYGTYEEKKEFLESNKYMLPKRLENLRKVDFFAQQGFTKGTWVQVCEKKNCRWEEVCGYKEKCEVITSVLCGASLAAVIPAGGWLINVVSGGAGGYACYKIGEKVCKNEPDCQKVEKCDEECHNEYQDDPTPGTSITNPYGQTHWQ